MDSIIFAVIMVVIGGLAVLAEIHTLTFYLLGIAIAAFASAAAAFLGLSIFGSLFICAVVLFIDLPIAHELRHKLNRSKASQSITDNDVGKSVVVKAVHPDGVLRVEYRGSEWDARTESETLHPQVGDTWLIGSRSGNILLLKPISPSLTSEV